MAPDDMVTKGARASTAVVLTLFNQNIPVSAPESLSEKHHCQNEPVLNKTKVIKNLNDILWNL